jgi:hypothetical protein
MGCVAAKDTKKRTKKKREYETQLNVALPRMAPCFHGCLHQGSVAYRLLALSRSSLYLDIFTTTATDAQMRTQACPIVT